MKNINYLIIVFFALAIFASGCKDEENEIEGKAVFSYIADGFQIAFTNFTFGADEYEWDFGDGSDISTLKSPVHVYSAKGVYMVSLNAYTNGEGSNFTDSVVVTGPNITIDGDFTDWEYVGYLYEHEESSTSTLKSVKVYASALDINFYFEGTEDMNLALIGMHFNTDNDPTTGEQSSAYPMGSGADIYCEGPYTENVNDSWGSFYDYSDGSWAWRRSFSDGMFFSKIGTNNGNKAVEFSISKDALGVSSGTISFAIMELNSNWSMTGSIPPRGKADSQFLEIVL